MTDIITKAERALRGECPHCCLEDGKHTMSCDYYFASIEAKLLKQLQVEMAEDLKLDKLKVQEAQDV